MQDSIGAAAGTAADAWCNSEHDETDQQQHLPGTCEDRLERLALSPSAGSPRLTSCQSPSGYHECDGMLL